MDMLYALCPIGEKLDFIVKEIEEKYPDLKDCVHQSSLTCDPEYFRQRKNYVIWIRLTNFNSIGVVKEITEKYSNVTFKIEVIINRPHWDPEEAKNVEDYKAGKID